MEPEKTWREDGPWFEGLLAVAIEHARYQLALGYRFLTVLYVEDSTPLVGRAVDQLAIPAPWTAPLGAPADWSK